MTRTEALHILGLDDAATPQDIQTAHRELAQMLHPDKFEGNKRLRARAEKQMRTINAARDFLLSNKAARSGARRTAATGTAGNQAADASRASSARKAARDQARALLVQQLADVSDALRRARFMIAGGFIALLIGFRLRSMIASCVVNSAGLTALVWGVQDLARLGKERRLLRARLKELVAGPYGTIGQG